MVRFKSLFFALLLSFQLVSSAFAEINWQMEETLDTHVGLPIASVAIASDGALWRTYAATKTTYIERIDPQSGAVTGNSQLNTTNYELKADTSDGNMWLSTSGGASLISPSLETLESRRGFALPLPGRRFYFNNEISTVGTLKTQPISFINPNAYRSYFSGAGLGLWQSYSDSTGITFAKIDLATGNIGRAINMPNCSGDALALSEVRAITGNCLFDPSSGIVFRHIAEGSFFLGNKQYSNSGYFVSKDSLALHVYSTGAGAEIWSLPDSGQPRVKVVGDTLIIQTNLHLLGFDIATGYQKFNVPMEDVSEETFIASENFIMFNRGDRTDIHSVQTGLLIHSIAANPLRPIASSMQIAHTDDAVYLSSLFAENLSRSFIQVTKRRLLDGSIVWRKTFQHDLTTPGSCVWVQCGDISIAGTASDSGFVLTANLRSGAIIHSLVVSLAPDTGLVQWRKDADFSGGVSDGALLYGYNLGNGAVLLSRTSYADSVTSRSIVDAVSGQLLWAPVGSILPLVQEGDFLLTDGRTVERVNNRNGQVKWRNVNADIDLNDLISFTGNEITYRARDNIWNPISQAQIVINRLELASGIISTQIVLLPSDFVRATAINYNFSFFQSQMHNETSRAVRLSKPAPALPSFLIISNSGTTGLIEYAGQRILIRPRGLGRGDTLFRDDDPSYGLAGSLLYWMDDINADGIPLNLWQSLPPQRYFGPEKFVAAYQAKSTSSPRIFLERDFSGTNTRYLISKISAIDAPQSRVSLTLSKRFIGTTQLGEYRYVLRVENTGRNPVMGAQVLSEFANVNSFSCTATNGSCNQTSSLGAFSLQLNLLPGGFATLNVLDSSTNTNSIGIIGPMDTVETDRSDNLVELGSNALNVAEFTDGFE